MLIYASAALPKLTWCVITPSNPWQIHRRSMKQDEYFYQFYSCDPFNRPKILRWSVSVEFEMRMTKCACVWEGCNGKTLKDRNTWGREHWIVRNTHRQKQSKAGILGGRNRKLLSQQSFLSYTTTITQRGWLSIMWLISIIISKRYFKSKDYLLY